MQIAKLFVHTIVNLDSTGTQNVIWTAFISLIMHVQHYNLITLLLSGANQFLGRLQDFKFFAETLTNR